MKIHYHSDCPFFGGCENILSNLLNSESILSRNDISYSFPSHYAYKSEADKRIKADMMRYPLILPDFSKPNYVLSHMDVNSYIRKAIIAPIYFLEKCYVFMIYDVVRLFLLFRKINPDILHINNGGYPAAVSCRAAVIAAKMANIKRIVFHVNNIAEDQTNYNFIKRKIEYRIDQVIKNNVDYFITGSKYAGTKLQNRGFTPQQVVNIPNTINPRKIIESPETLRKRFSISNDDVVFGIIALLTKRKGHNVLLDAFSKLRDKVVDFSKIKLVIVGIGEDELKLKAKVNSLDLTNNVIFTGEYDNAYIYDMHNMFDIFVLSSISDEDMPYVIVESMSIGKPIIGTKIAGIPEEIDNGINGFVVNASDANELTEAMLKFIEKPDLISIMGKKSKEIYAERFSYQVVINRIIEIYDTLYYEKK